MPPRVPDHSADDEALDPEIADYLRQRDGTSDDGADDASSEDDTSAEAADQPGADVDAADADDVTSIRAELERERTQRLEYERRFKGLQGRTQQEVEKARQLEQTLGHLEAALAQAQIAQLPQEQQSSAWERYQNEQQQRQQQQQQEFWMMQAAMQRREAVINEISTQTGIPREELEEIDHPVAIRKYAERIAKQQATAKSSQTRQRRRNRGSDRFEGGGNPSRAVKKPQTMAEARQALLKNYRFVVE